MDKPGVKATAIEGEPYWGQPTRFFTYWGLHDGASPSNRVSDIVLVHGGAGTAFDTMHVTWNAFGRTIKKAEFVSTASRDANWEMRPYEAKEIPFGDGRLECAIPPDTVLCWINLTCEDGIVASSRNF